MANSILNRKVPKGQASPPTLDNELYSFSEDLANYVYGADAIHSLIIERVAWVNDRHCRGAVMEDLLDYTCMSSPALQVRVRNLREKPLEGSDTPFLAYKKDGLKYLHYSRIPYALIREINAKRGLTFDKVLSKFFLKHGKPIPYFDDQGNIELVTDSQVRPERDLMGEKVNGSPTELQDNLEENDQYTNSGNSEDLLVDKNQHSLIDLKESSEIDVKKALALLFKRIVSLTKEVEQLKQENTHLKLNLESKFLGQQERIAHLEQELKEGTNRQIANALDELLTIDQALDSNGL
ncbi:hypothetical protein [Cylindrospermum sp. FACHB-282]|uniref:hypothetical protein n=1 Tax=Cylindrospermum sp. FACHB-282 TaxID=2692794 RepID=UPI0016869AA8|nr:hypothetical protein [Cylindrospermum sp. FACHB-282]MBD2387792.1 hypothetical protein [Cylindrospermum sp. FACHB-282]